MSTPSPTSGTGVARASNFFPLLSLVVIFLVYAGLALWLGESRALWSPDVGARLAMIRNWVEHGSLVRLDYPEIEIDPEGRVNALAEYATPTPNGLAVIYTPLFPLLAGVCYRIFGLGGLVVVPVLAGLIAAYFTWIVARELGLRSAGAAPLVLGLATPLALYSVVFWDHSLQIMLVAGAALGVLRCLSRKQWRWGMLAGGLLGTGIWIHEVFIPLTGAAVVAALLTGKEKTRLVSGLLVGAVPVTAAWVLTNGLLYRAPLGPHFMGPNVLTHPYHIRQTLDPGLFWERILSQTTGESALGAPVQQFLALLGAYLLATWIGGGVRALAPLFYLVSAGFAVWINRHGAWSHGLFAATPLLIPALGGLWPVGGASSSGVAALEGPAGGADATTRRWMRGTALLFGVAVLVNPKVPGMDWGSRYLLTVLPLLYLLAAACLEGDLHQADPRLRWGIRISAVALLGASLASQWAGLLAIRGDLTGSRKFLSALATVQAPLLISDQFWVGPEATVDRLPYSLYYWNGTEMAAERLARILRKKQARRFAYHGTEESAGRLAAVLTRAGIPLRPDAAAPRPPGMGIQYFILD